jgi:hypothetical protein
MAGQIKLPFIGETKTQYVVIGGLVVAGVVGYALLPSRQQFRQFCGQQFCGNGQF